MLSNPAERRNDGPGPLPKCNHGLGLIHLIHGPAHDVLSKKLYNNRLSFLHCNLLRQNHIRLVKIKSGRSAVQFCTLALPGGYIGPGAAGTWTGSARVSNFAQRRIRHRRITTDLPLTLGGP